MKEITSKLSDLVVMQSKHTKSYIFHKKNFTPDLPVSKTLIEYNTNSSEENEEEKEPIDIEFTEQKADPETMKILLTLNEHMYKKKMRKIIFWLTWFRASKANWWRKSPKKVTRRLFDDYSTLPNEKKN